MAEDFDPEAYLDSKLDPQREQSSGQNGGRSDDRDSDRKRDRRDRSRSKDRRRSRSKDRRRSKDRDRDRRSRSRDRKDRDRDRRSDDYSRRYDDNYKFEKGGGDAAKTYPDPVALANDEEGFERDLRTIFVAQVARKADERDLFTFFSDCGKVTDVRIIKDSQTRRSKGIAYVEFESIESCQSAILKSGQLVCGFPIVIQPSQAEKNQAARLAAQAAAALAKEKPTRVMVGNLHPDIQDEDLVALFTPFGSVLSAKVQKEPAAGGGKFAFVEFKLLADAQKAVAHLNGFDLAGQALRVQVVIDATPVTGPAIIGPSAEILDDTEMGGVHVSAQSRAALMAKLARNTDLAPLAPPPLPPPPMPTMAMPALANIPPTQMVPAETVLLVNMFDPTKETEPDFQLDIQEDVTEECSKYGKVLVCVVDKHNPSGLIYVKFDAIPSAERAAQAINGRFFAGKQIAVHYLSANIFDKFLPRDQ
mmetsp:Transcript_88235/g.234627  ORF Transcript_88235/g.234627 Transcript_88235/m.234627 type:complete len:476 (-) Transcript_88235:159-1586(-)